MEMQVLSRLSAWLLAEPGLRQRWGESPWKGAFLACGSPSEWDAFSHSALAAPILAELHGKVESLQADIRAERGQKSPKAPLPDGFAIF